MKIVDVNSSVTVNYTGKLEDGSILVKKMIVKGIKRFLNKLKEKTRDLL